MATSYDASDGANPGIGRWNKQVVPDEVGVRELQQHPDEVADCFSRVVCDGKVCSRGEKGAVALFEHGVVEGVLRVEVRVERRLAKADHRRKVSKRDRAEPVAVGERPGRREDLLPLRLLAPRPGISLIYH